MAATYDQYHYPQFWEGRDYEHGSEVIALQKFLNKIPHIKRLIDIGAGYGRMAPYYIYRARRSVLVDSSSRQLKLAKQKINHMDSKRAGNVRYIHVSAQRVPKKVKNGTFDVVICIRMLHHINRTSDAFYLINKLLTKNGYLILEFPNRLHGKARAKRFIKKGLRKLNDEFLPQITFDPIDIELELKNQGFEVVEKRSVSNIRNGLLKKHLPISALLFLEDLLQIPLSYLNFGPSIFILARKKG